MEIETIMKSLTVDDKSYFFKWEIIKKFNRKEFIDWWDPDAFIWQMCYCLTMYCHPHFEIWWDPERYNWYYSDFLCQYCSRHFEIWYDSEKFTWSKIYHLQNFCQDYKHLWEKDYLIWKLKNA